MKLCRIEINTNTYRYVHRVVCDVGFDFSIWATQYTACPSSGVSLYTHSSSSWCYCNTLVTDHY